MELVRREYGRALGLVFESHECCWPGFWNKVAVDRVRELRRSVERVMSSLRVAVGGQGLLRIPSALFTMQGDLCHVN